MSSSKQRTARRERRKAKASGFRRGPKKMGGTVAHGPNANETVVLTNQKFKEAMDLLDWNPVPTKGRKLSSEQE